MIEEFGVSRGTLREALNLLSHEGLIARKQGSGTYVKDTDTSCAIAVIGDTVRLSSPLGYWYHMLMDRLCKRIAEEGYKAAMWVGTGTTSGDFLSSTALLDGNNIQSTAGVLNTIYSETVDRRLTQEGILCVNIGAACPIGQYSVVLDYVKLNSIAADLMIRHGYTDFVIMCDTPIPSGNSSSGSVKVSNLVFELQKEAVGYSDARLLKVNTKNGWNDVYDSFKKWWNGPNRSRAIFFHDDAFFDIASRAISELGIKVPQELAILTHANVGRDFQFPMPVTRIGFDADKVADQSVSLLKQLIRGDKVTNPVLYIPPVIVDGQSL
jgi:DNA-binding LacI/PurR family transcriptional regulator